MAARRLARWLVEPDFADRSRVAPFGEISHRIVTPMARAGAEPRLEAGKRHNVRLAATAFHGIAISASQPLSFWRTLGPATAARGFDWGMELRSGCAIPAIGGGLCLISNALFALAVELGWHVLERHGHSMALVGRSTPMASLAGHGPDPYDARAFAAAIQEAPQAPNAPAPIPSIAPLLAVACGRLSR